MSLYVSMVPPPVPDKERGLEKFDGTYTSPGMNSDQNRAWDFFQYIVGPHAKYIYTYRENPDSLHKVNIYLSASKRPMGWQQQYQVWLHTCNHTATVIENVCLTCDVNLALHFNAVILLLALSRFTSTLNILQSESFSIGMA